jgi:hypothetical protein
MDKHAEVYPVFDWNENEPTFSGTWAVVIDGNRTDYPTFQEAIAVAEQCDLVSLQFCLR